MSFSEVPVDVLAEASNTTRSLVVVLEVFVTPCMGRQNCSSDSRWRAPSQSDRARRTPIW